MGIYGYIQILTAKNSRKSSLLYSTCVIQIFVVNSDTFSVEFTKVNVLISPSHENFFYLEFILWTKKMYSFHSFSVKKDHAARLSTAVHGPFIDKSLTTWSYNIIMCKIFASFIFITFECFVKTESHLLILTPSPMFKPVRNQTAFQHYRSVVSGRLSDSDWLTHKIQQFIKQVLCNMCKRQIIEF